MKVVVCKHCGANFQIDDEEDINTYECTLCAGDLEYDTNYSTVPSSGGTHRFNTDMLNKSYNMVQCESCGLKFRLDKTDNILDYECSSCGGQLRFLDEDLNEELVGIRQEQKAYEDELTNTNTSQTNELYLDDDYIYVDHSPETSHEEDTVEVVYTDDSSYTGENTDKEVKDYIGPSEAINDNDEFIKKSNFISNRGNNLYPNTDEDLIGEVNYISNFKVPDSLDYNELKTYLIFSYAENMDYRYDNYRENLKKKLKI